MKDIDVIIKEIRIMIPQGKENAIHQKKLSSLLKVSPMEAKRLIKVARQQGEKILSNNSGYWYSESDEEVKAFVSLMKKQAITRLKSISRIQRLLDTIPEQICIDDFETESGIGEQEKSINKL